MQVHEDWISHFEPEKQQRSDYLKLKTSKNSSNSCHKMYPQSTHDKQDLSGDRILSVTSSFQPPISLFWLISKVSSISEETDSKR